MKNDPMLCPACGKDHDGRCREKTIPLSVRLSAGVFVDGDRSWGNGRAPVTVTPSVIREVRNIERLLRQKSRELRSLEVVVATVRAALTELDAARPESSEPDQ